VLKYINITMAAGNQGYQHSISMFVNRIPVYFFATWSRPMSLSLLFFFFLPFFLLTFLSSTIFFFFSSHLYPQTPTTTMSPPQPPSDGDDGGGEEDAIFTVARLLLKKKCCCSCWDDAFQGGNTGVESTYWLNVSILSLDCF
jgi:hypothetical protein